MPAALKLKSKNKEKEDSLVLSIVIHLILLLIFLFPLFNSISDKPKKPTQFQGIQVALGVPTADLKTNTSSAAAAAPASISKPATKPTSVPKASKAKPKTSQPNPPKAKKIISKTVAAEAPVTAVKKKTVSNKSEISKAEQEKAEKLKAHKAAALAEAQQAKEKLERERADAAKRKAEAEAKAKAKADAKSKFDAMMQNADDSGASSKGNPDGHPDASALEGMTTGTGKTGNGLGDRSLVFAPEINDNSQKQGRVVMTICVNARGKVIKANYTQKGSTTTSAHLIDLAKKNAKKYEFSQSSVAEQCGEIIIDFKLK